MNNDRFKFRVWDIKNNKYDYDVAFIFDNNSVYMDGHKNVNLFRGQLCYDTINSKEIDIEQCISLKDKNGKLGFENDVVVDKDDNKFVITWIKPFACFGLFTLGGLYHNEDTEKWLEKYEIIGNIHENKE
jgi:hypothetical protein